MHRSEKIKNISMNGNKIGLELLFEPCILYFGELKSLTKFLDYII